MFVLVACGPSEPPNCESAIRGAANRVGGDDKPSDSEIAELVSRCINEKWTGTVRAL
jgi:hypothetical protein